MELHPLVTEIRTPDGLLLPAFLFEPETPARRALIVLHGNGSSTILRHLDITRTFADEAAKAGIAYLAFSNRGAGYVTKVDTVDEYGAKDSAKYGMAYELIRECADDIDGAISFLKERGYDDISLIGFSTGANKICVYNYYKPENEVARYVLACGGDDTGIYYSSWGAEKFNRLLDASRQAVAEGRGRELVGELAQTGEIISYQSLRDTLDPDGDYNVFPYYEHLNGIRLGTKELFREYASIRKPALVAYGERDEYCYGEVPRIIDALRGHSANPQAEYLTIEGADHGFTGKERELARAVMGFIGG